MALAFTSCCCVDFDITKNDEFGSLECCNIHVYAGPEHAQQAQKPVELKF